MSKCEDYIVLAWSFLATKKLTLLATFSCSFKVNISFKWAGIASSHCFRLSADLVWYRFPGQVFHVASIIIRSKHLKVPSFVYIDLIFSRPPLRSQEFNLFSAKVLSIREVNVLSNKLNLIVVYKQILVVCSFATKLTCQIAKCQKREELLPPTILPKQQTTKNRWH